MRVFVTGGNGFIGSAVVRRLANSGHEVVCLLRATSDTRRIDDLRYSRAPGDVRSVESLRAPMLRCDCTIHLAAPGGWTDDRPSLLHEVIEGGTRNVLDAAAAAGARHRVIVVSSTAAIAASDRPHVFDESAVFNLADRSLHYAQAKHRAELLVGEACSRGLDAVIVNPAEVYGPGDHALGTARNLVDFATAAPVLVCDGGTSVVHVDDVAAGIVAALERGRAGERYILGGENLSVRELAECVIEMRGRRAPIVMVPNPIARALARTALALSLPVPFDPLVVPYATRYWFMDAGKARRELGVTFRDARATIRPTLDWLGAAGHLR